MLPSKLTSLLESPNEHPPHFSVSMIEGNDKATQFYTGLPTWAVFFHLFMFISPFASSTPCVINLENQLFITLTKLRLNLLYKDLAGRCGVSIRTISTIFDRWLDIMYSRLKFLSMAYKRSCSAQYAWNFQATISKLPMHPWLLRSVYWNTRKFWCQI